jgi:L-iditol 2-dehydrogenase
MMKAALYRGPKDLEVIEVDKPTPKSDEILIKVHACATCGTDAKIFNHGHQRLTPPQVIGHEIAGEIVEIGSSVSGHQIGDRVQIIAAIPCGSCWACKSGKMQICINQLSMGYQFAGGFAEYMIVPNEVIRVDGVNRIPENLSYDEAAAAEPLACAINAQELINVGPGDVVLVMGAGPIGCMHVRLARALGAVHVTLADVNAHRLKLSADVVKPDQVIDMSQVDIEDAVKNMIPNPGPNVIITAAPAGQAQEQAVRMIRPGGRISFFGGLPKDKPMINIDSNLVHYKELILAGANGSTPAHNKQALELMASGKVKVSDLLTHRVSLDNVQEAIDLVLGGEAIKVVVKP